MFFHVLGESEKSAGWLSHSRVGELTEAGHMPQNFLASVKERCERNIFLIRHLGNCSIIYELRPSAPPGAPYRRSY